MAALLSSGSRDQSLGITNASRSFRAGYREGLKYVSWWGVRNGARGLCRSVPDLTKDWTENVHGETL